MGVPYEFMNMSSGRHNSDKQHGGTSQHTGRIFSTNMTHLCNHLQRLLSVVYVASFGGEYTDAVFQLKPSPRMEVRDIDDLKTLIECGVVSVDTAMNMSEIVFSTEISQSGGKVFQVCVLVMNHRDVYRNCCLHVCCSHD